MKKLAFFLPIALLAVSLTMPACAQTKPQAAAPHLDLNFDLLSDTGGVNMSPYLKNLIPVLVQQCIAQGAINPYQSPEEAIITITIAADGHLSAMRMENPALDTALDKAAWNTMKEVAYLPPPSGMRDPSLKLRVHFTVD